MFTSNSPPSKKLLICSGIGVCALAGLGYYVSGTQVWKRRNKSGGGTRTALDEAEARKALGIELFKLKQYEEAIDTFTGAMEMLREIETAEGGDGKRLELELLASCENNIAASYNAMQDLPRCIEHCTAAIGLKPGYAKAIMRRAKCFQQLNMNRESLDDYFDLITMGDAGGTPSTGTIQPHQMAAIQHELDKVAEALIAPDYGALVEARVGHPQKISQTLVAPWQFNLAQNDPLLLRMAALDGEPGDGLDAALAELKRCNYDGIASLASAVADDERKEPLERAQAVLLAARFLHYQALEEQAMAQRFTAFWDQLDEAQRLANKDLHVAQLVLQMDLLHAATLLRAAQTAREEDVPVPLSEHSKQDLAQLAEEALRINPRNADPLLLLAQILMSAEQPEEALAALQRVRRGVDREHRNAKYYECYAGFLCGLRQQNMGGIHNSIVELERLLAEAERPPIFALLMLTKVGKPGPNGTVFPVEQVGILMQNNDMAMESTRRAIQLMPNNSYAIYLLGMMDQPPSGEEEAASPQRFGKYLEHMETAMHKAIEADKNYWEPYRMLGKISMNRLDFVQAQGHYDRALELARSREELMVLLKERLMVRFSEERKKANKRLPRGMLL